MTNRFTWLPRAPLADIVCTEMTTRLLLALAVMTVMWHFSVAEPPPVCCSMLHAISLLLHVFKLLIIIEISLWFAFYETLINANNKFSPSCVYLYILLTHILRSTFRNQLIENEMYFIVKQSLTLDREQSWAELTSTRQGRRHCCVIFLGLFCIYLYLPYVYYPLEIILSDWVWICICSMLDEYSLCACVCFALLQCLKYFALCENRRDSCCANSKCVYMVTRDEHGLPQSNYKCAPLTPTWKRWMPTSGGQM